VNTRLSIVTSVGALAAALAGLTPACGSDGSGTKGRVLGNDGGDSGGASNGGGGASAGKPAAGGNGATGGGSGATPIGQTCIKSSDCGNPKLTCLLPTGTDFDGGGVSNGVCTLDCSADLTAVVASQRSACADVDETAICLQVSNTKAFCVESCTEGPVPTTETKCHKRHDMACADPRGNGSGYCKPTCRGDFDCASANRICDLSDGVCKDKLDPVRTLPSGAKCDPNASVDRCAGTCVGVVAGDASTTDIGFCSGFCKLGDQGCGFDPTSTSAVDSFCLFGTSQQSDADDLGFCAQLCDCNDECRNPDFICTTVQGLSTQTGRTGACSPKDSGPGGDTKGIPCAGGRKDAGTGGKTGVEDAATGTGGAAGAAPVDAGHD
jgi:hypothetical protein